MRLFVDDSPRAGSGERLLGELWLRQRAGPPGLSGLDEIEWSIEPGRPSFVLYRLRVTSSIRLMTASLGNAFDAIGDALKMPGNDMTLSGLYGHLPILAALTRAGQNSDLSGSALMRFADPHHDGVKNWLVATRIGGEANDATGPGGSDQRSPDEDFREALVGVVTMSIGVVHQTLSMPGLPGDLAKMIARAGDLQELGRRLASFPPGFSFSGLSDMVTAAGAKLRTGPGR